MAHFEQTQIDGATLLRLSGTLNQECVDCIQPGFRSVARLGGAVVVDLSGVDVINTPGLAILIAANRDVKHAGGRMVITQPTWIVDDALHRCLLDQILTIVPNLAEAIARAKEPLVIK